LINTYKCAVLCFSGMDMTLYIRPHVFTRRLFLDVHVIMEAVPTGKMLLPRSYLAYVTKMAFPMIMFAELMPRQTVNFFPLSLINLFESLDLLLDMIR